MPISDDTLVTAIRSSMEAVGQGVARPQQRQLLGEWPVRRLSAAAEQQWPSSGLGCCQDPPQNLPWVGIACNLYRRVNRYPPDGIAAIADCGDAGLDVDVVHVFETPGLCEGAPGHGTNSHAYTKTGGCDQRILIGGPCIRACVSLGEYGGGPPAENEGAGVDSRIPVGGRGMGVEVHETGEQ